MQSSKLNGGCHGSVGSSLSTSPDLGSCAYFNARPSPMQQPVDLLRNDAAALAAAAALAQLSPTSVTQPSTPVWMTPPSPSATLCNADRPPPLAATAAAVAAAAAEGRYLALMVAAGLAPGTAASPNSKPSWAPPPMPGHTAGDYQQHCPTSPRADCAFPSRGTLDGVPVPLHPTTSPEHDQESRIGPLIRPPLPPHCHRLECEPEPEPG